MRPGAIGFTDDYIKVAKKRSLGLTPKQKIMMQIVSGQRKAGDKVPAVRELAAEAGVNPNTMQRALADLERQGLLYTNRTSGRYVTEDEEMITKIRERIAEERICAFLESMSQLGFTQEQVLGLIQREREEKNA